MSGELNNYPTNHSAIQLLLFLLYIYLVTKIAAGPFLYGQVRWERVLSLWEYSNWQTAGWMILHQKTSSCSAQGWGEYSEYFLAKECWEESLLFHNPESICIIETFHALMFLFWNTSYKSELRLKFLDCNFNKFFIMNLYRKYIYF